MLKTPSGTPGSSRTLQSLIELVRALDRRIPGPPAAAETQVAADAAQLRTWAVQSIDALRAEGAEREQDDLARALAVMTDDGAPVRCCPPCGAQA